MPRKHKSRISFGVRVLLLVPLPIIAFLIYRAGQTPRHGLFEAELMAAAEAPLELPNHLAGSGFTLVDTIQTYNEKNLYEKVDGHDVAYFRFGFVSLTFASYSADGAAFVDCYAFRMGRREGALGIYANERSDEWSSLDMADAGYESGGAVFFYRGPWYVQIIPSESTPETMRAATELTDSLMAALPAPGGPLPQLAWFPEINKVAGSEGFMPDNAFGTDFLGDIFTAGYAYGDAHIRAFCHVSDSAQTVFGRYLAFMSKMATPMESVTRDGVEIHRFSAYGEQTWVANRDDALFGIDGITDSTLAETVFEALATSVSAGGQS